MAREKRLAIYTGTDQALVSANDELHRNAKANSGTEHTVYNVRDCERYYRSDSQATLFNDTGFLLIVTENGLDENGDSRPVHDQPSDAGKSSIPDAKVTGYTGKIWNPDRDYAPLQQHNTRGQSRIRSHGDEIISMSAAKNISKKLGLDSHPVDRPSWLGGLNKPQPHLELTADQNRELHGRYLDEVDRLARTYRDFGHHLSTTLASSMAGRDEIQDEWVFEHWGETREVEKRPGQEIVFARGVWKLITQVQDGTKTTVLQFLDEWPRDTWAEPIGWAMVPKEKAGFGVGRARGQSATEIASGMRRNSRRVQDDVEHDGYEAAGNLEDDSN
ncbi:hypothetical protein BDV96DRAFT_644233 [Lophiotrema nucula]|uniref:Uncharacterized protein n=1 Tax=Lophiotrema nucula TaxID=690887 RepID=A0A6A5ZFL1_9PLEO|nr:hypothetical protein BDV96DRAFT_644233 [Lophiotrema nucula]